MSLPADRADRPEASCATPPAGPAEPRRDVTWDLLSERLQDLIIVADAEGIIFYASPASRNFGYEPHELIGLTGEDLVHPDDLAKLRANSAGLLAPEGIDRHADREHRFRRADGSWVWMEGNPSVLPGPGGEPGAVLNVFRDISDRRASREAMWEQARRASMLEAVAGVGYWRLDAETLEAHWSEQIYRMYAMEPGDVVAFAAASDMVHPDDKAGSEARVAEALRSGEGWKDTLTRIVQPDGSLRYLSGRAVCETDVDGKVTAVFGTVLDVTEQEELKAKLRDALAAAERAAAVKAEFLANMSHEIRTPLTAVLGFSSLLSERRDLDPTAQGQVARIASASRALLAVVNDVLDFSKLEAGEVVIRRRPSCPAEAGREVLEMFAGQAEGKGLDLRFDAAADLPQSLLLDEDRLRQILINLVGNAVKFTDRGRVSLGIGYERDGARLVATVTDTGAGISAEARRGLFQRFSQVDASSTRTKGGTGLGLAICLGLAEAMGGAVSVESRVGRGSTFRLELPALENLVSPTGDALQDDFANLCGVRVLVVDDNAVNRELARAILEPAGVEVSEARDGLEAVEIAQRLPFDVILMDLRMPGMDGREALATIRRTPGPNQHMPILAYSADGMMDSGAAGFEGFQGLIRKPTSPLDMLQTLLRAISDDQACEQGIAYAAAS